MHESSQRILQAACKLFQRHGEAGVSVRAVASAAKLSPMALYRHYANKAALIDAVAAEAFTHWESRVAALRARGTRAWLEKLGEAYLRFALEDPQRFTACFDLRSDFMRRVPDDFHARRSPAGAMIAARIDEGLASGELRGADAVTIGLVLWSQSHGLISMYRSGRFAGDEKTFTRLYRRCLTLCLSAFLTEKSS